MENDDGLDLASKRLQDLWGAWGLRPDTALGDKQLEALGALKTWLLEADALRVVAATQILMLNPQSPTAHQTKPAIQLADVLANTWGTARTQPSYVQFFQAMLLACWPSQPSGSPWELPRLLDPVWAAIHKPEHVGAAIEAWRKAPSDFGSALYPIREITTSGKSDESIAALEWFEGHEQNLAFGMWKPYFLDVVDDMNRRLEYVERTPAESRDTHAARVDLMWWGQAKYCRRLRRPYRRVEKPGARMLHLAVDVADRMALARLPYAPTAAFLAEVAADLGLPWDEERTLGAWVAELNDALCSEQDVIMSPVLKGLGSTGLPVLALAAGEVELNEVEQECGVVLQTQLDRAEWLRWLLGELTLARVIAT